MGVVVPGDLDEIPAPLLGGLVQFLVRGLHLIDSLPLVSIGGSARHPCEQNQRELLSEQLETSRVVLLQGSTADQEISNRRFRLSRRPSPL